MNPFIFEIDCDVCGGPGAATPQGMAAQWREGTTVSHRDPSVCKYYLEQKERNRERETTTYQG